MRWRAWPHKENPIQFIDLRQSAGRNLCPFFVVIAIKKVPELTFISNCPTISGHQLRIKSPCFDESHKVSRLFYCAHLYERKLERKSISNNSHRRPAIGPLPIGSFKILQDRRSSVDCWYCLDRALE